MAIIIGVLFYQYLPSKTNYEWKKLNLETIQILFEQFIV